MSNFTDIFHHNAVMSKAAQLKYLTILIKKSVMHLYRPFLKEDMQMPIKYMNKTNHVTKNITMSIILLCSVDVIKIIPNSWILVRIWEAVPCTYWSFSLDFKVHDNLWYFCTLIFPFQDVFQLKSLSIITSKLASFSWQKEFKDSLCIFMVQQTFY